MSIVNTSTDPISGMLIVLDVMGGGNGSSVIEGMEAQGQAQLVQSELLPTQMSPGQEAFEALGFTFGEPAPGDELFRKATLPAGWSKKATDHSMHTEIVDQHGRHRVGVFYKAAFYDRRADMNLIQPSGYLMRCLWDKTDPVLDDSWLTPRVAKEELAKMHAQKAERHDRAVRMSAEQPNDNYWEGRAAELAEEADAIKALMDRIPV